MNIEQILDKNTKAKITKCMVDDMLQNAETLEDIDMDLLYTWLKITKTVNNYGQIKLLGQYITTEYFNLSKEDVLLFGYTSRLLSCMNSYTNILMKNHKTPFRTWKEIYEHIGVKSKTTQTRLKQFCEKWDLVRIDKTLRTKDDKKFTTRFIVNPFLTRKGTYIGQIAIARFQDWAKEGINMNCYVYRFLQCVGVIDNYE